ncbi:UBP-type zinc finger domain-containing protein [Streptomyces sp. NPDC003042]
MSACEDLDDAPPDVEPIPPVDGCAECLAQGERDWVHLRLCLSCGHIGCCDSSPGKHASAHFHRTGHPVIRSYEADEDWRWCFAHEVIG